MSALASNATKTPPAFTARQDQILDAAETCFVRNGYHRSTMQDLAREASMSSPNIYRYFVSKEAVLLSMAERERRRATDRIAGLEAAGDKRAALMSIIAYYHLEIPREATILRVELWSEATRNPEIGAIMQERETQNAAWFIDTLTSLATSPHCDPEALYEAIVGLLKGIIVNRAVLPDYDPAPAVAQLHALLDAGLAGRLPIEPWR
ncbi:TetR/AcrR family transcriptional regulator [Methylobacterium sp. 10]|uniref:TetR/AcrR family transcriptional regulator n=1 Tax=Methylobacterium sp. 10 TaxID=1101191 RepID=UPI000482C54A|nr:TetR/AcrR family transcriptional regulator [Methylobacterium sp. 10]